MNHIKTFALSIAILFLVLSPARADIGLTIGSGNYYVSVGDYDYLPYAMTSPGYGYGPQGYGGGLSFNNIMGDYGTWVNVNHFGQAWRPYVAQGWRPYTQGHWTYTQYGPTWVGYEPWAWAGYHYGNWVFAQNVGWVWVPGYEWHPGRVQWSQGYNSLGWMPMPPQGYDYIRGYLGPAGPINQFTYYDDDFGIGLYSGGYYNTGGPYYDPRYQSMYYNPSYLGLVANLWTFIDRAMFDQDNYADYYYGDDYARQLFDQRLIRITSRPVERTIIERMVQKPIRVENVQVKEVEVDRRKVRVVAVDGEQESIKKNANRVVRETIAPAFAEKQKTFKGKNSKGQAALEKGLRMQGGEQNVRTVQASEIVQESRRVNEQREQKRSQMKKQRDEEVQRITKEGKIKDKKQPPGQAKRQETQDEQSNQPRQENRESTRESDTNKERPSQAKPQERATEQPRETDTRQNQREIETEKVTPPGLQKNRPEEAQQDPRRRQLQEQLEQEQRKREEEQLKKRNQPQEPPDQRREQVEEPNQEIPRDVDLKQQQEKSVSEAAKEQAEKDKNKKSKNDKDEKNEDEDPPEFRP